MKKTLLLLLSSIFIFTGHITYATEMYLYPDTSYFEYIPFTATIPTTSLTAYWKLNNNSVDEFSTHNGTDTNISYTAGKLNEAASFNGSTSKIEIAGTSDFKLADAITISAWFKSSTSTASQDIFTSGNLNVGLGRYYGFILQVAATTGYPEFLILSGNGTTQGVHWQKAVGTASVITGAWVHIVGTYDQNNIRVFINGSQSGSSVAWTTDAGYEATNFTAIGMCYVNGAGGSNPTNGWVDDIFVMGRAITSTEITTLYNSGTGAELLYGNEYTIVSSTEYLLTTADSGSTSFMSPENIKIMITCLLILVFLGIADFFRRLFAKRK